MSAQKFLESQSDSHYEIIFIDPPYETKNQAIYDLINIILKKELISKNGVMVIERATKSEPLIWPKPLSELRTKEYGVATLYYGEMQ